MSDLAGLVERLRHCSENTADEYLRELTGRAADALEAFRWRPVSEAPQDGQAVAFVASVPAGYQLDYLNGRVLGGTYHDGVFSVPGIGFDAKCWMPLPPAPEQGD